MSQRTFIQYRAVCVDRPIEDDGVDDFERGVITHSRSAAESELASMMQEANPTFDEGWIESRTVTAWERCA